MEKRLRYSINDCGSGLGHFISLGLNTLLTNPSFLLIDEPELNLHPPLQQALVSFLSEFSENGLVYATHSVGLAKATADQIFCCKPNTSGYSTITRYERTAQMSEFLGEMSFSSYQELGFSALLFVEGKTDVPIFQHWLRKLGLGKQVVVLPLGGTTGIPLEINDLQEAKRICNNIFVVIDSEKTSRDATLGISRKKHSITV